MKIQIKLRLKQRLNEIHSHSEGDYYYNGSIYPKLQWSAAKEDVGWATEGYGLYITPDYNQAKGYAFKNKTDGYIHKLLVNDLNIIDLNGEVPKDIQTYIKSIPNFFDLFNQNPDIQTFKYKDYIFQVGDNVVWEWDELEEPLPEWAIEDGGKEGVFLQKFVDNKPVGKIIYGLKPNEVWPIIQKNKQQGEYKQIDIENLLPDVVTRNMPIETIGRDTIMSNFEELYWYLFIKLGSLKKATAFFRKLGYDAFKVTKWNKNSHYLNLINPTKIISIETKPIKFNPKNSDNYLH